MRRLRLSHLRFIPEVWRCVRTVRRPAAMLSRYLQIDERYPVEFEVHDGPRARLDSFHDLVTAWVVFFRKEYVLPPKAATIFDLGANIGLFSLFAAWRNNQARIFALEPFPETYRKLQDNLAGNDSQFADRIATRNIAVAHSAGVRHMAEEGPSQSRGVIPEGELENYSSIVAVQTMTIGEVIAEACEQFKSQTIDFMKLDIEGGEHEVLVDAHYETLKPVQAIGMEYHPNGPRGPLFERLQSAGLQLVSDRKIAPDWGIAHFRRASL